MQCDFNIRLDPSVRDPRSAPRLVGRAQVARVPQAEARVIPFPGHGTGLQTLVASPAQQFEISFAGEEAAVVADLLLNPPPPTEALLEAFRRKR